MGQLAPGARSLQGRNPDGKAAKVLSIGLAGDECPRGSDMRLRRSAAAQHDMGSRPQTLSMQTCQSFPSSRWSMRGSRCSRALRSKCTPWLPSLNTTKYIDHPSHQSRVWHVAASCQTGPTPCQRGRPSLVHMPLSSGQTADSRSNFLRSQEHEGRSGRGQCSTTGQLPKAQFQHEQRYSQKCQAETVGDEECTSKTLS